MNASLNPDESTKLSAIFVSTSASMWSEINCKVNGTCFAEMQKLKWLIKYLRNIFMLIWIGMMFTKTLTANGTGPDWAILLSSESFFLPTKSTCVFYIVTENTQRVTLASSRNKHAIISRSPLTCLLNGRLFRIK